MKHELKKLSQQTNNKYLNIFLAEYEVDGGIKNYQICSRKKIENLQLHTPDEVKSDGVRILPYYYDENGKIKICFIKEFRYAVNSYCYGLPAGLIDDNENPFQSAERELNEEIGAKVVKMELTDKASYCSVGLGDESIISFEAEVTLTGKQNLDFSEDIELVIVDFDDILNFVDTHNLGVQSRLQAKCFYYKKMYEILKGKL